MALRSHPLPSGRRSSIAVAALEAEYPRRLKEAGIGGTAQVWLFIDAGGRVRDVRLNVTSGHAALDQAALRVAEAFAFTPATNQGEATPVWVTIPITFVAEAAGIPEPVG